MVAQAISTVSVSVVGLAAYRRYPQVPPEPLGDDRAAIRSFAIQSTIASGLTSVRTSLPTVLVGVVAKSSQVANFRAAQAPQTAFLSLSAPARLVLISEQTRDVERGRSDRAYALLNRYIGVTIAICVVVTPPLWIFMPTLVRIVFHPQYVPAANAFRVMLLAAVIQFVFGWTKSFPVSIGRPGLRTIGQSLEIAALVPAVLVLGALYGATGAAGGVLVGSVVLGVFWTVGLVRLRSAEAAPMRVLIVSGIWPPDVGGPASHAPEVAAFLRERGHEVEVVTTADTPPAPRSTRCDGCGDRCRRARVMSKACGSFARSLVARMSFTRRACSAARRLARCLRAHPSSSS